MNFSSKYFLNFIYVNLLQNVPDSFVVLSQFFRDKNSEVIITTTDGSTKTVAVPKELPLIVKAGDVVKQDQPFNLNPNVGGFGQAETEIVLQSPARIYGYAAFVFSIIIAQAMLVLKKKQFEKVQAAEIDF